MKRIHVTTKAHQWMDKVVTQDTICVDATAGNGNDTLYLSLRAKAVFAFDIQPAAIENTKRRCAQCSNVTVILASHENIVDHVPVFDLLVFNLGYLPNSDASLTTTAGTTLSALANALPHLTKKGHLLITFYRRHPGGNDEYETVSAVLKHNDALDLLETYTYDEESAPVFQVFQKR